MNDSIQAEFEQPASHVAFIQAAQDVFAAPEPCARFSLALADLGTAAKAARGDVPGAHDELRATLAAVALLAAEIRADPRHPAADAIPRHLARILLSFNVTLEEMRRWPGFVHKDALTSEVQNHG